MIRDLRRFIVAKKLLRLVMLSILAIVIIVGVWKLNNLLMKLPWGKHISRAMYFIVLLLVFGLKQRNETHSAGKDNIKNRRHIILKIKVSRDSVCMGDDAFDNTKTFSFDNDNITYEDLFNEMKNNGYFPSLSGNNVVWVLTTEGCNCIFSYFTRTDKLSMGLSEKSIKKICQNSNKVHLKYYSSPERWKEKIEEMHNEGADSMYEDSWFDELRYCNYVTALGYEQ